VQTLLFISADAAQEKKESKVLLPTGISKSAAQTVMVNQCYHSSTSQLSKGVHQQTRRVT
jgi:hypothetical protein